MRNPDRLALIGSLDQVLSEQFGDRAKRLHELSLHDFPVPKSVALSFEEVDQLADGDTSGLETALSEFGSDELLAVRISTQSQIWTGIQPSIHIGMSNQNRDVIAKQVGEYIANSIYGEFLQAFAVDVAGIKSHQTLAIEDAISDPYQKVKKLLELIKDKTGVEFPQNRKVQFELICRSIVNRWHQFKTSTYYKVDSGHSDARIGLIIQSMADGSRCDGSGTGKLTSLNWETGAPIESGHLIFYRGGNPLYGGGEDPVSSYMPGLSKKISKILSDLRKYYKDPQQIEYVFDGNKIWLLDAESAERSVSGAIRAAVDLANDGIISRTESLHRVTPDSLSRILHPQVKANTNNRIIAKGIPASPGAAVGKIAFSSQAAERIVAAGHDCILMRAETGPEDFRGMHSAQGVLTGRGGLTSHAAVVARGLGVPCVVGASDIQILPSGIGESNGDRILKTQDGEQLNEGDVITIDGTTGTVLMGSANLVEPALDEYFESFLSWADDARDIGVKANADTIDEVKSAKKFKADGIGLCRTEHMYFEESQLSVMRRMLFVESPEERKIVLQKLIQMQQRDFAEIFRQMPGHSVCIRLFDPPLHEFLPRARREMKWFADELGRDVKEVMQRAEELKEFNPMLGMRGVRVGIVMPEIYEMQARAIFEAVVEVYGEMLEPIPEIMIPLVSANREVDVVQRYVDNVAKSVRASSEVDFQYRLGVMVETPRAALRSGDLAKNSDFLSFGTNDLTQMTYGLSRDDSQRFMDKYIDQDVYPSDPFGTLDREGVGELLKIAVDRARQIKPQLTLSICGEHGGDPVSIQFCRDIGFDYVSCSPYRVPIARLAAAQYSIESQKKVAGIK